jgi:putative toxin-antitoxin system antitoxin component (TIGR02293 family)
MAQTGLDRTIEILGGRGVFPHARRAAAPRKGAATLPRRSAPAGTAAGRDASPFEAADERTVWTRLVRACISSAALRNVADQLHLSINELSQSLRLPARTIHRRLANAEQLSPEETERSFRAARALARAQQLLGLENGRRWLLAACPALGGERPVNLLDTADGFNAVLDELGRLEYGVLS